MHRRGADHRAASTAPRGIPRRARLNPNANPNPVDEEDDDDVDSSDDDIRVIRDALRASDEALRAVRDRLRRGRNAGRRVGDVGLELEIFGVHHHLVAPVLLGVDQRAIGGEQELVERRAVVGVVRAPNADRLLS